MSDERQASDRADELVYTLDAYAREREVSPETRSYQEWSAAFEAVRDYIAALEADRARLDWLERAIPSLEFRAACDALPNKWPGTFREFVDAALSASSPLAPTQEGA